MQHCNLHISCVYHHYVATALNLMFITVEAAHYDGGLCCCLTAGGSLIQILIVLLFSLWCLNVLRVPKNAFTPFAQTKDIHVRLTSDSNLTLGVSV